MLLKSLIASAALAAMMLTAIEASAADVEVKCEKRSNRSRASVDGSDLTRGMYRAVLKSGGKVVRTQFESSVGDEAQFDFDSNPNDIADGATAIPPNFIVDGRVKGYLVNENRQRVTPIVTAICRIRR